MLRIRIRDPVPFWPLDPGSGIGFFRIPDLDPGSQTHTFENLVTTFWAKSSIILWKLAQIFFFSTSKLKKCTILWNLCLDKRVWHQIFSLLLLFLDPGSEIRDPGSVMGKNQDPGSGINIPDPQHYLLHNAIWYWGPPLITGRRAPSNSII